MEAHEVLIQNGWALFCRQVEIIANNSFFQRMHVSDNGRLEEVEYIALVPVRRTALATDVSPGAPQPKGSACSTASSCWPVPSSSACACLAELAHPVTLFIDSEKWMLEMRT